MVAVLPILVPEPRIPEPYIPESPSELCLFPLVNGTASAEKLKHEERVSTLVNEGIRVHEMKRTRTLTELVESKGPCPKIVSTLPPKVPIFI